MSHQIYLKPGLTMESLPKTRILQVIYREEALMRLQELENDWLQAAQDTGEDITSLTINVSAFFCDIRRLIGEL